MIRQGSYVTVSVEGHASAVTPDSFARAVSAYLDPFGFDISQNTITPTADILSNLLAGNVLEWDYVASVTLRPLVAGYEQTDAIVAIVRQCFHDVTGYEPTGASVQGVNTHAPATPVTSESGLLHTLGLDALARGVADVADRAQHELNLVLVLVVGLAALVLYLIAYGPNVPQLATIHL